MEQLLTLDPGLRSQPGALVDAELAVLKYVPPEHADWPLVDEVIRLLRLRDWSGAELVMRWLAEGVQRDLKKSLADSGFRIGIGKHAEAGGRTLLRQWTPGGYEVPLGQAIDDFMAHLATVDRVQQRIVHLILESASLCRFATMRTFIRCLWPANREFLLMMLQRHDFVLWDPTLQQPYRF